MKEKSTCHAKSHCAVIIVTHNSERYLHQAVECVQKQSRVPNQIIIVDSASSNTDYLTPYRSQENITLALSRRNIGFAQGNNLGMSLLDNGCGYVLFLNPDTFLTASFLEEALAFMENPANGTCGAMTGPLLGYCMDKGMPTGKYDSTGIFNTWYGKWYDRAQGRPYDVHRYKSVEEVPAICGALMLCRKTALDAVLLRGSEVFDSTFWMYKEDIDLSCRLSSAGWKLIFNPHYAAYHCRGWNPDRSKVPAHLKRISARNELTLHLRLKSPIKIVYSCIKFALQKVTIRQRQKPDT